MALTEHKYNIDVQALHCAIDCFDYHQSINTYINDNLEYYDENHQFYSKKIFIFALNFKENRVEFVDYTYDFYSAPVHIFVHLNQWRKGWKEFHGLCQTLLKEKLSDYLESVISDKVLSDRPPFNPYHFSVKESIQQLLLINSNQQLHIDIKASKDVKFERSLEAYWFNSDLVWEYLEEHANDIQEFIQNLLNGVFTLSYKGEDMAWHLTNLATVWRNRKNKQLVSTTKDITLLMTLNPNDLKRFCGNYLELNTKEKSIAYFEGLPFSKTEQKQLVKVAVEAIEMDYANSDRFGGIWNKQFTPAPYLRALIALYKDDFQVAKLTSSTRYWDTDPDSWLFDNDIVDYQLITVNTQIGPISYNPAVWQFIEDIQTLYQKTKRSLKRVEKMNIKLGRADEVEVVLGKLFKKTKLTNELYADLMFHARSPLNAPLGSQEDYNMIERILQGLKPYVQVESDENLILLNH